MYFSPVQLPAELEAQASAQPGQGRDLIGQEVWINSLESSESPGTWSSLWSSVLIKCKNYPSSHGGIKWLSERELRDRKIIFPGFSRPWLALTGFEWLWQGFAGPRATVTADRLCTLLIASDAQRRRTANFKLTPVQITGKWQSGARQIISRLIS